MDEEQIDEALDVESVIPARTATELAEVIYDWARNAGAMVDGPRIALASASLSEAFVPTTGLSVTRAEARLKAMRIVAVTADDAEAHVAIFAKNKLTDAAAKDLPTELGGVTVEYVGGAELATPYPQVPVPMSTMSGSSRFWTPSGRFACGSSVMVAPIHGAGTLGALIRLPDGRLYGLSSNHVTGDCNHTEVGMYIMCPAGIDAAVGNLPPTAIGKHSRLTPINTGDPGQIRKQELDAAIFEITDENIVTSWQGNMEFDTPMSVVLPSAHLKVKKVGRTSGLLQARLTGKCAHPSAFLINQRRTAALLTTQACGPCRLPAENRSLRAVTAAR